MVPAADLAIGKTGPTDPVIAGTGIDWTVTVTNNGPSVARDVTVADPAPVGVTGLTATSGVGSCTGGPARSATWPSARRRRSR